jgi:Fe-Mn family superoxide dismutase
MHTEHDLDQTETRTVNRRRFLQTAGVTAALTLAGAQAWLGSASAASGSDEKAKTAPTNGLFTLPPLPYDYSALEPHIDALTMQIHHTRHHAAYVTNLNTALKDYPDLQKRDATDLISNLETLPEAIRTAVRNNGGGHVNHSVFWAIMAPKAGGEPQGQLRKAIGDTFGDFAGFKAQINDAATRRFGSGWAWLVMDAAGKLQITSTANQDSPYMMGQTPLLGVDVWEHAYYLKYQNRRADYLNAWWNVVNWQAVAQRFEKARG